MGFPRQEYWSEKKKKEYWSVLPFPPPGDVLHQGIEPTSPAPAGGFFTMSHQGSPSSPIVDSWLDNVKIIHNPQNTFFGTDLLFLGIPQVAPSCWSQKPSVCPQSWGSFASGDGAGLTRSQMIIPLVQKYLFHPLYQGDAFACGTTALT